LKQKTTKKGLKMKIKRNQELRRSCRVGISAA
jgi:hypothetical protein